MSPSRLDAVWAAVYVRVLSATGPTNPVRDHQITGIAECLADATQEREDIAIAAADAVVARLSKR